MRYWTLFIILLIFLLLFYFIYTADFKTFFEDYKKYSDIINHPNGYSYSRKSITSNISNRSSIKPFFSRRLTSAEIPETKYIGKRIAESKGEQLCRQALEEIYGKKFPRVRPSFLRNPETGMNLELDCYNDELKIACEYNGEHHYVFPNRYHKTEEEFTELVRRDEYKKKVCEENGIYLLVISYKIDLKDIKNFIDYYRPERVKSRIENAIRKKIPIPNNPPGGLLLDYSYN